VGFRLVFCSNPNTNHFTPMSRKTWLLTDDATTYVEQISLGPNDVGGSAQGYSVTKRTLRGGPSDGVDVIEVNNGRFWFVVVPTRGMGIHRAGCGDVTLGWKSPIHGPVHPSLVPLWEPSGIGWLGGFDEWLVRCGLESNGAPEFLPNGALRYPLHGKIANTPAHRVEVAIDGDSGEIAVTGVVDEARLFGNKLRMTTTVSTQVGRPGITVLDEITNFSAESGELELLYHINSGLPLVGPGARIVLPVKKMAPHNAVAAADVGHWDVCDPETPGKPEACFFFDLAADASGRTEALLESPAGDRGVSVRFNKKQLPYFTLWKNRMSSADGYVTGLEPAINFPNPKSFEKRQGRVAALAPGETRRFEISIEAHADAGDVAKARQAIRAMQGTTTPEIASRPNPEWSAG
jgi:hypothetical protein